MIANLLTNYILRRIGTYAILVFTLVSASNALKYSAQSCIGADSCCKVMPFSRENIEQLGNVYTIRYGDENWIMSSSLDVSGQYLAAGTKSGFVFVVDTIQYATIGAYKMPHLFVDAVAFVGEQSRLVTAALDGGFQKWDVQVFDLIIETPDIDKDSITDLDYNSNLNLIATGQGSIGGVNSVRLWDAETLTLFQEYYGHESEVVSVTFTPDDHKLISGDATGQIRVWDISANTLIATVQAHDNWIYDIAHSPKDSIFATVGSDGRTKLWSIAELSNLADLAYGESPEYTVKFSPDGLLIFTGGGDGMVAVWDAITYDLITTIKAHSLPILTLNIVPQSNLLITGASDGELKFWTVC